jgi:hypothetical protein
MSPDMRRAKLAKLCEIEGFEHENDLFAAAISDSICPAICCNSESSVAFAVEQQSGEQARVFHSNAGTALDRVLGKEG